MKTMTEFLEHFRTQRRGTRVGAVAVGQVLVPVFLEMAKSEG
jgi:hypothetical protein